LYKIFYSKSYDSCLYSYVIEDDYENRQCDIDGYVEGVGNMAHYDNFIIEDYLNNKFLLLKTKGCNDFSGTSFDDVVEKYKN
jgi:hypothetical protein